jgi:hypothetical protein
MGSSIRTFLVDENDCVRRLPTNFLLGQSKKAYPEYAGKRVRFAMAIIANRNRKPLFIEHIDCGYIAFDRRGRLDESHRQESMRSAVECISEIGAEEGPSQVIDASRHFAMRRYRHESGWKPTPKIIYEMKKLIFGRRGDCGK